MTYNLFINYLQDNVLFEDDEIKLICSKIEAKSFKKNQLLLKKGEDCQYMYFVNSGIYRNFYISNEGKEVTRLISYENKFFTNFLSFQKHQASQETIQCVESGEILCFKREDYFYLINSIPKLQIILIKTLSEYHLFHLERLQVMTCFAPFERLLHFKENYSKLFYNLSNKIIASYCNITPETCSRIKRSVLLNSEK